MLVAINLCGSDASNVLKFIGVYCIKRSTRPVCNKEAAECRDQCKKAAVSDYGADPSLARSLRDVQGVMLPTSIVGTCELKLEKARQI